MDLIFQKTLLTNELYFNLNMIFILVCMFIKLNWRRKYKSRDLLAYAIVHSCDKNALLQIIILSVSN